MIKLMTRELLYPEEGKYENPEINSILSGEMSQAFL